MKSVILSLLLVLLVPSSTAQEQGIQFPTTLRCGTEDQVHKVLDDYNELGFAESKGIVWSTKEQKWYASDIKIYLSYEGSFTITAQMDEGVICVLATGEQFKPLIPVDKMH